MIASFNAEPHVPTEHTIVMYPTDDVVTWGTREKVDYVSRGQSSTSSTTYAKFNLNEIEYDGAQVVYIFRISGIPTSAEIESVTCDVKASVNDSTKVEMTFELWKYPPSASSSAVGSTRKISSTNDVVRTIGNRGVWTAQELNQDVYLFVGATRKDSPATGEAYGRFYGADLHITYVY